MIPVVCRLWHVLQNAGRAKAAQEILSPTSELWGCLKGCPFGIVTDITYSGSDYDFSGSSVER